MATPRETLKYYFRKYALPTEQQFAELIDAFVHKDEDTLTQEKIDGLITELAGKVSKETFENFKTEIQGAITSSGGDLSALTAKVTTAESNITSLLDDVVTNADNISGLNQRVGALEERPQITVDSTLDSESTNPVENKAVTEALGTKADSADVTALSERVSTLENAEPPQVTGNYLKQIADLDSYEGTDGEIVQYIGATNDKYRRGFCYEKKAAMVDDETTALILYTGTGTIINHFHGNPNCTYDTNNNPGWLFYAVDGFARKEECKFTDGQGNFIIIYSASYPYGKANTDYIKCLSSENDTGENAEKYTEFSTRYTSNMKTIGGFKEDYNLKFSDPASWQVIAVSPCVN